MSKYWTAPTATISWDNLKHIRVYGLNPDGDLVEWAYENDNTWKGPTPLGVRGSPGFAVAATNDGNRIRVYYHGQNHNVYEMTYEPDQGWRSGAKLP
ncbi:MAG: hypothetical protein Q9165_006881 [Trypethelium subeluteriae]